MSGQDASPRGKGRWLLTAAVALAGIALAIVVAAWAARLQIAEAVVAALLEARGVDAAELEVVELGLRQARARNVRLGADGVLEADDVTATYDPAELLDGRLDEVTLSGLRLRLVVSSDGVGVGSLDPLFATRPGTGPGMPALPRIVVRDAEIAASTPIGPIRGTGSGRILPSPNGAVFAETELTLASSAGTLDGSFHALIGPSGETSGSLIIKDGRFGATDIVVAGVAGGLTFASDAGGAVEISSKLSAASIEVAGAVLEILELAADLDSRGLRASAQLAGADGRASLALKAGIDRTAAPRIVRIEIAGAGGSEAALWQAWGLPPVSDGRIELSAAVGLPPAEMAGTVSLRLSAATALIGATRLDGPELTLDGRLSLEGRALTITEPAPGSALRLGAAELDGGWRLGGPLDVPIMAGEGPLLAIQRADAVASYVAYDVALGRTVGHLLRERERLATITLPASRIVGTSAPAAGLHRERLTVTGVSLEVPAAGLRIDGLDGMANVQIERGEDGPSRLTYVVTAGEAEFRASAPLDGAERLELQGRTPAVDLRGDIEPASGRLAVVMAAHGGFLLLPAQRLRASGLGAKLDYAAAADGAAGLSGTFAIDRIAIEDPVPPVVPLRFAGTIGPGRASQDAEKSRPIALKGELSDAGRRLIVDIEATHDPVQGEGRATAASRPLAFRRDGLQPGELFPALRKQVADAEGQARLEGRATWRAGRVAREAKLTLGKLSLKAAGAAVRDLDGTLAYRAPELAPFGAVTIAEFDPGFPITGGVVRARLTPALTAEIAEMSWRLADGRLFARDVTIDPRASRHRFVVEAEGIDAARLLADARVTGVNATGRLSGAVPVTIEDGRVTVSKGRIASAVPGTIRYKREAPLDELRASRPQLALFVEALENFQYDRAEATVDQRPDGETVVGLHIRGKNPDVLQGQPFELNLNISGNLDEIVGCFLQGYCSAEQIGQMLLQFME